MVRPVPRTRTGYTLGTPGAFSISERRFGLAELGFDLDRAAIRDTLFLGYSETGVIADLAMDQSQYLDDQATGATWHFEASPASRFDVLAPYTIELAAHISSANTGQTLAFYGSGASRVHLTLTATSVQARINNVVLAALDLPDLGATPYLYLIAWGVTPNPDTTGAADACLSTVTAWNLTTGALPPAQTVFTHADRAMGVGPQVWWASTTAGTATFTGAPVLARWSAAYHTPEETYEELVTATGEYNLYGEERFAVDVPPRSSTIGDDGYFAGPVHILSAAAVRENDMRLASPLVNVVYRSRTELEGDLGSQPPAWVYTDPEDATRTVSIYLQYLHYAPVPPAVKYAHVRVFLRSQSLNEITVVAYSMSQPGHFYRPATSPLTMAAYHSDAVVRTNHGSGELDGEWVDVGRVRIALDNDGGTYFALGFAADATTQTWRIAAMTVDPVYYDPANGP